MRDKEHTASAVLAIGNFDGLHKGHQVLLQAARRKADDLKIGASLLSFSPHPRRFFNPGLPPFRLVSDAQKCRLARHFGMDGVRIETFDGALSQMPPADFVTDILLKKHRARHIVIGYNFRFGAKRAGDAALLRALGEKYGFGVTIIHPQGGEGGLYTSSQIRADLQAGRLEAANTALGWPWEIEGRIIHGEKRGRDIGYPTANMDLGDYQNPRYGVYAVTVFQESGRLDPPARFHGVANIGIRPMFALEKPLLETHLFDFDGDLYGQTLRVRPVAYLRGEEDFQSLKDLIKQIDQDAPAARRLLQDKDPL